jgi:hypothetical protein
MRYVVIFVVGALAVSAAASGARAETPTPSATGTAGVTATPTAVDVQLNFTTDPLVVYWEPVPGAVSYHLSTAISAVAVNAADPFCTPAMTEQSKNVDIDSDLPASPRTYEVVLPPLDPADKWFVHRIEALMLALDEGGETIATGGIGYVAETLCGGPPSPPEAVVLTADTTIGGCLIPAGFIEVTTQAALDHGQRVFADDATRASRIYVKFRTGGCVHLAGGVSPPFPEFLPSDEPLSPPGGVPDSPPSSPPRNPRSALAGPDTGTGPDHRNHDRNTAVLLVVAASAIVMLAGGVGLRRRRR